DTFCQALDCTDLEDEFRALVACFEPLELVEATLVTAPALARPDDDWSLAGRYRVKEVLGKGGLGIVYRAEGAELEREVALKCMQRAAGGDPGARDRFLREAKLTGRLDHPGVVPVHALATGPSGDTYYTMRVITGETLRNAITRFHNT